MKFEIVKLHALCGKRVNVYSVILEDEDQTLFERFIIENNKEFSKELADIRFQLKAIAERTGIRENFFEKPEGKLGQDIWAMYVKPHGRLRLYCMQLGRVVIILGGGGPKQTRTFQEDPKLNYENGLMRMVSDAVTQRILDKEIKWTSDHLDIAGDFMFDDDTEA